MGYDPEKYREVMEVKMKDEAYFYNLATARVTPDSDLTAWDDLSAKGTAINEAAKTVTRGNQLPAALSSFACRGCPFKQLCAGPLRYNTPLAPVLEVYFKQGDKPFEFEETDTDPGTLTED